MKSLHHYKLVLVFAWREGQLRKILWRIVGRYACTCRDGVFKSKAELQDHLDNLYSVTPDYYDEPNWRDE
jgi:hypothetical protein